MTPPEWDAMHHQLDGCLHARAIDWKGSFIAQDGSRSICQFEAAYAEQVREACREAGLVFEAVWRVEILPGQGMPMLCTGMHLVLAEVTHAVPLTDARWQMAIQRAISCSSALGVQRLMTYMTVDRQHSICVYQASSAETVRTLYRTLGIAFERVWRSHVIAPSEHESCV